MVSQRPAVRTSSEASSEPRTESGERRVADPAQKSTRVSEKFRMPSEALPSEPPAPSDEAAKATARMPVLDSVRLLQVAIPTPQAFSPQPPTPPPPVAPHPFAQSPSPRAALAAPRSKMRVVMIAIVTALALIDVALIILPSLKR